MRSFSRASGAAPSLRPHVLFADLRLGDFPGFEEGIAPECGDDSHGCEPSGCPSVAAITP